MMKKICKIAAAVGLAGILAAGAFSPATVLSMAEAAAPEDSVITGEDEAAADPVFFGEGEVTVDPVWIESDGAAMPYTDAQDEAEEGLPLDSEAAAPEDSEQVVVSPQGDLVDLKLESSCFTTEENYTVSATGVSEYFNFYFLFRSRNGVEVNLNRYFNGSYQNTRSASINMKQMAADHPEYIFANQSDGMLYVGARTADSNSYLAESAVWLYEPSYHWHYAHPTTDQPYIIYLGDDFEPNSYWFYVRDLEYRDGKYLAIKEIEVISYDPAFLEYSKGYNDYLNCDTLKLHPLKSGMTVVTYRLHCLDEETGSERDYTFSEAFDIRPEKYEILLDQADMDQTIVLQPGGSVDVEAGLRYFSQDRELPFYALLPGDEVRWRVEGTYKDLVTLQPYEYYSEKPRMTVVISEDADPETFNEGSTYVTADVYRDGEKLLTECKVYVNSFPLTLTDTCEGQARCKLVDEIGQDMEGGIYLATGDSITLYPHLYVPDESRGSQWFMEAPDAWIDLEASGMDYYLGDYGTAVANEDGSVTLTRTAPGEVEELYFVMKSGDGKYESIVIAYFRDGVNLKDCEISLSQTSFVYDGEFHLPHVTVTHNGYTLSTQGYDYSCRFHQASKMGKVLTELDGRGPYRGHVELYYQITPDQPMIKSVTNVYSSDATKTGTKLVWNEVPYADGYRIYRKTGSGSYETVATVKGVTSYIDTKAKTNGTKYVYYIKAYAKTNATVWSKASAKVTHYALSRPALSSLKSAEAGVLTGLWKKNTKCTGYQLQYALNSGFTSGKVTHTLEDKDLTGAALYGMKKGKTYYVRLRSYKTVSGKKYYSPWSAAKKIAIKK